ncbi:MAG: DNA mismatch endonuclease Vsr [Alphaproteobacteria bacterium]|nr:MAG: DNA mismatch endonuclease Vsr [Alphaproteobacteria bacterium]
MVDRLTPERRSWLMSRVKSKNTSPEMRARRLAHAIGLRFRLHRRELPGKPDLIFPRYRVALFVHGCFWHRHPGCTKASTPKSRTPFWETKFQRNVERDKENEAQLTALGWRVLVIWECETKSDGHVLAVLSQVVKELDRN